MVSLNTLKQNSWWESSFDRLKEMKKEIEKLDSQGIKCIKNIHTISNSSVINYFVSMGFKEETYHTIEGTKTTLYWS